MKPRPLTWADLKVVVSRAYVGKVDGLPAYDVWRNRKGEMRVYASLNGCSFVNQLFWLKEYDEMKPETRTMILDALERKLVGTIRILKEYVVYE